MCWKERIGGVRDCVSKITHRAGRRFVDEQGATVMRFPGFRFGTWPPFRAAQILAALSFLFFGGLASEGHIGSNNIFYEGVAGSYQVRVMIRPPDVIPGLAQINVRVHNGPVTRIGALPVRWDAGRKGAPPADLAKPVPGETNLYSTELWIMDMGAYSVFIDVDGPLGQGTAIVPLNSVSTKRLEMPRWMGAVFGSIGAVLFVLMVAIVGAAVREGSLFPTASPAQKQIWRGRIAMGIAAAFMAFFFYLGNKWWTHVDRDFQNNRLFKPLEVQAKVVGGTNLLLDLDSVRHDWRDNTPLAPDHGKMMHLFLVKTPQMDSLAHLHPIKETETVYQSSLPDLPPGDYSLYADITHESGLTQTLTSRVSLQGASTSPCSDPDDSWFNGQPQGESEESKTPDGFLVKWAKAETIVHDREVVLKFDIKGPDGKPAPLEPYMGMWAHLAIRSEDGSVFIHLHPAGTISVASQELFAKRERERSDSLRVREVICGRPDRDLTFPYSFPTSGKYRLWLQIKANGQIITAPFDVFVE